MEITDEELAKFIEEDWSFMVQPVEDIRHEAAKRIRELATLRSHSAQAFAEYMKMSQFSSATHWDLNESKDIDEALKRFNEEVK